jgi:hypothetical protein
VGRSKTKENKVIHGQYIRSVDRQLVGGGDTFLRLSRLDLRGETGSEIIAAQDQPLRTHHAKQILYKKQRANAEYVNNWMRQQNT